MKTTDKIDKAVLTNWYESAYEASRKKRWEWFVIDQYLRGNHNIRGNYNTNTVEIVTGTTKQDYSINLVYATFRAIRGFVTRHRPMVQVEPSESTEEAKAYARRANKLLERDNILNNFRKINKEWAYFGVKYGIGYRQVGYDPVRHVSLRYSIDPCDVFAGGQNGEIEDAPYIIKTVKRTIGYLREKYPKPVDGMDYSPDNELAADEYKRLGLQLAFGQQDSGTLDKLDTQTKIVKECWYRTYKQNKAGGYVNLCIFVDEGIIEQQETPFTEYPFISYKSDIVPNEAYGEGHIKHVLAPQRLFNMLNTQLLEYNHLINKGRFITDKNSGLSVITDKNGQIIQVNPGKRLTAVAPPPISPVLQTQIDMSQQWLDTIGGLHDASRGAVPQRVTSGDAIEALQMGDSNNISDLRDNFEDALALEAQWILKMYALFEKDGIVLSNEEKNKVDTYAIMGAKANPDDTREKYFMEDNGDYCDICRILPDNQVKVSISSQLGETKSARLQILMRLVEMGLPFETLLNYLEFPNVNDIFERIASERVADIAMEQMKQAQQMQTAGPQPQQQGVPMPPVEE